MVRRPILWLLVVFSALPGCMHLIHPSERPQECTWRPIDQIPDENKNVIHVFMIDSLNPFSPSLMPLREHLHHLKFGKTYHGQTCHRDQMMVEMGTVHATCPEARFVIIGCGTGAATARELAAFGAAAGIPVEFSLYIEPHFGGAWVDEGAASSMTIHVRDLVSSQASDPPGNCSKPVTESNFANHPELFAVVERELTLIGMGVPPPKRREVSRVHLVTPIPAPRDTEPRPKPLDPDWLFLRPRHPWDPPLPRQRPDVETLPLPRVIPDLPPPTPLEDSSEMGPVKG